MTDNQHGAACPQCGDGTALDVAVKAWARLMSDGADIYEARQQALEFDEASACECNACGWRGTFGAATGESAPMIAAAAGFSIIPMRDLNKGKPASEGTQFEECDAGRAELWSVFFTPEGGESNLIDDCPTESAARALVERMQELETLDDGTPMRWQNTYECECGNTWTDTWDSCCDDECAACGKDISPSESVDLASA